MAELTKEEKIAKRVEENKKALAEKIAADTKAGFLNPFDDGVNYEHFLKACGGADKAAKYCEGKLTKEQIEFLVEDLKHYKQK